MSKEKKHPTHHLKLPGATHLSLINKQKKMCVS